MKSIWTRMTMIVNLNWKNHLLMNQLVAKQMNFKMTKKNKVRLTLRCDLTIFFSLYFDFMSLFLVVDEEDKDIPKTTAVDLPSFFEDLIEDNKCILCS